MKLKSVFRCAVVVLLLVAMLGATAQDRGLGWVETADLGGPDRYLTHVSTDKPIYRPGEQLYVRGVVLHAGSHAPRSDRGRHVAVVQITGPKGDIVASGHAPAEESVVAFAWPIPAGQPGGQYTIKITHPFTGDAPGTRKFDIRAYRAPRLKSQIKFLRDGYGPGDTVAATVEVKRAEGGIPANAKVTITARVDGVEVHRSTGRIDAKGLCTARFELPARIERGEGTLAFVIEDGGVAETATKTIPILLQTVDLSIYPEGGNLVGRLKNRVYFEAKTPTKKPADLAGVVVDSKGQEVCRFRSEHEGRGRFTFTPEANEQYTLKITEPSGINTTYPLPKVKDEGVILRATEDRYAKGRPVTLEVTQTGSTPLTLTLSKRDVQIGKFSLREVLKGGTWTATFNPPDSADGVLVATVWDDKGTPLAERLIYRQPAESVHVNVVADQSQYVPAGQVKLTVTTTDDAGRPISAVVGLAVTDDSVLEMIEKREQAPRLPVMVLLEDDVTELADAHVYLDEQNPKSAMAVDLLLGTQGWRRFAFVDSTKFLAAHGDAARRVLAMRVVTRREWQVAAGGMGGARLGGVRRGVPVGRMAAAADDDIEAKDDPEEAPAPVAAAAPAPPLRPAAEMPAEPEPKKRKQMRAALEEMQADLVGDALLERKDRHRHKMPSAFVAVRVYAHQVRADRRAGDRVDFAETLYWNAAIKTDAKTGQATAQFDLSDAVTAFRVFADAFDRRGALGTTTNTIESVQPFYIEPKLPLEVTSGDLVQLPVGIVNATPTALPTTVKVTAAKGIDVSAIDPFDLAGEQRVRKLVELGIGNVIGDTSFVLAATAGPHADRVTRPLRIVARGFPVEVAHSGMLEPNGSLAFEIDIPKSRVPGSVSSDIAIYPTPLASLTESLERLIREPCGCFEQTSSTTYPLVMAQQYFMSHQGVDPKLIERSTTILEKGYNKLIGFECDKKGYEWFGADPGHEALTAYGLLQFSDMGEVRHVDKAMLTNTRSWLLKSRDGEGGFKRERRALHTWIADPDCSNSYITWALLESGEPIESLQPEIELVKASAAKSSNSYVTALGANVAAIAGDKAAAGKLMDKLVAKQTKDGYVDGATTSIVGSGGTALQIETTSLAVLAWLREPAYAGSVEKAIGWLADVCKAGRFGSTQSTVLALRAIVTYDADRAKPKSPGAVTLLIDGKRAGSTVKFDKDTHGAIKLTDIAEMLEPGTHKIEIHMTDGSAMPCSVAVNYANETPASSDQCKIDLKVALADTKVDEGQVTESNVTVTNKTDKAVPTTVAIIGIPGGLEVRHDQLKELVKAKRIAAYEVIGRDVVLYWRSLEANRKVDVPLSLVAAVAGRYTGPASRAYEYYTDEYKTWVGGMKAQITPLGG